MERDKLTAITGREIVLESDIQKYTVLCGRPWRVTLVPMSTNVFLRYNNGTRKKIITLLIVMLHSDKITQNVHECNETGIANMITKQRLGKLS